MSVSPSQSPEVPRLTDGDRMRILGQVNELLLSALAYQDKLHRVLELMRSNFGFCLAVVNEISHDGQWLEITAVAGGPASMRGERLDLAGTGIVVETARTGQRTYVPDVAARPDFVHVHPASRSEYALPLLHEGRVCAVLNLESPVLDGFPPHVRASVDQAAAGLSVVLLNQQLLQQAATARDHLADLYDNSPVWSHSFDAEGRITEINRVALQVLGCERKEVVGRGRLSAFCSPDSAAAVDRKLRALRPGGTTEPLDLELTPPHGQPRLMRVYYRPFFDGQGNLLGGRSVLLDITHESELQRQLVEAQKMQAVGTLTSGIAHDFNNILTTVLGQIELLQLRYGNSLPEDARERLQRAEQAGRRAAGLVSQLLTFARQDPQEMARVEPAALISSTVELLKHGLPENIIIRKVLGTSEVALWGNFNQLQQALVNLAVNAQHAMPEGGTLEIGLESVPAPRGAHRDDASAGSWVALTVQDSGKGMTTEVRERIFEPFFTTKPPSQGGGLGLAIVHSIVKVHGGQIEVQSVPGAGATFRLLFPPYVPAPTTAAETNPPSIEGGSERLLLVEDDVSVAETTAQILISLGYSVVVAHRPSEALRVVKETSPRFDLVVSDVTMPEMDGYRMAEVMQRECGALPFLFVTGYDFHAAPTSSSRFMLQKPLTRRVLADAVRRALAGSA